MKKILFNLCVLLVILQSCSSDNPENSSSENVLVGKWEVSKVGSFAPGTIITESTPLMNFPFACASLKDYCQFGNQGSFKLVSYNSNCSEGGGIGTYTKTDNIINIYENSTLQVTWEMISLTNSTLKIKETSPNDIVVTSFRKI